MSLPTYHFFMKVLGGAVSLVATYHDLENRPRGEKTKIYFTSVEYNIHLIFIVN